MGGFFPPIWQICSSNWIISPSGGEQKKHIWNHRSCRTHRVGAVTRGQSIVSLVLWALHGIETTTQQLVTITSMKNSAHFRTNFGAKVTAHRCYPKNAPLEHSFDPPAPFREQETSRWVWWKKLEKWHKKHVPSGKLTWLAGISPFSIGTSSSIRVHFPLPC